MTVPRNRQAVERSRCERAAIRSVWLELLQAAPFEPVTAKALAKRLTFPLAERTVRWHMLHIRADALAVATDCIAGVAIYDAG